MMSETFNTIISSIASVSDFIWSVFSSILGMILETPLIAFPVVLSIVCGSVLLVIKLIRKFGVKGKH